MNSSFPRLITLLRKERKITQKQASIDLGISQALLSHYEKGIRECGLNFLVKCADYYDVSCDYLLGRSPEPSGQTLAVDEIPSPDQNNHDNRLSGSVLSTLNKKLIANSLNILFDVIAKSGNIELLKFASDYLFLSVYSVFRIIYSSNQSNNDEIFNIPENLYSDLVSSAMLKDKAYLIATSNSKQETDISRFTMSTESLSNNYPLFASSLFNLVKNAENTIEKLSNTKSK